MTITIPPDPNLPEAQALAEEIRARQLQLRIRDGVGYGVINSTIEERTWLNQYGQAETRLRRERREAERQARRSK